MRTFLHDAVILLFIISLIFLFAAALLLSEICIYCFLITFVLSAVLDDIANYLDKKEEKQNKHT